MAQRTTQREQNPYKNSDSNKRYYTYEYYLRRTFGGKCAKIPLDGGFTCPNIDGSCGRGGCIYCSDRGSGDFAASAALSISEQFRETREKLGAKWNTERCIAYFQAHTNTYAPLEVLKEKYEAALAQKGVVGMNIATRADCLPPDVLEYLASLAERTVLTVELGLQSSNDETARRINRGHSFEDFLRGYEGLRAASDKINICVHIILGLPGEDEATMLRTVSDVAALRPHQVKLHLLHVIKGTAMAGIYERGEYTPLEKDEYVDLVCKSLELLPPETVIGRLTGDGLADDLLAPLWSKKKVSVINDIDKRLFSLETYQGAKFKEN